MAEPKADDDLHKEDAPSTYPIYELQWKPSSDLIVRKQVPRLQRQKTELSPSASNTCCSSVKDSDNRFEVESYTGIFLGIISVLSLILVSIHLGCPFDLLHKMRPSTYAPILAAAAINTTHGIRILQSNDDGWAESYLRQLHTSLKAAGHSPLISAPAENQSGTSSLDSEPSPRTDACQYDSCPTNAGPIGTNSSDPSLNWVNSFPVTSIKYGFDHFAPLAWGPDAAPELVVTGPNVGSNLWLQLPFSGTVGAAVEAVKYHNVPALAFSGLTSTHNRWDVSPVPLESQLYADLAVKLTSAVIASGPPYLPPGVFLNTNFPKVTDKCNNVDAFKFVMTRVNPYGFSGHDTEHCGGSHKLPTETEVALNSDCYVSVSVADANDKTTAPADKQKVVLDKLGEFLTCFP